MAQSRAMDAEATPAAGLISQIAMLRLRQETSVQAPEGEATARQFSKFGAGRTWLSRALDAGFGT